MSVIQLSSWKKLQSHFAEMRAVSIGDLFAKETARGDDYKIEAEGLYVDYSKHRLNQTTLSLLLDLARERKLAEAIEAMFSGLSINRTENRPVLHVALRNRSQNPIFVEGKDVMPKVRAVLAQMAAFSDKVRSGEWCGFTGKKIRNVINIGIGGADF